MIFVSYFFRKGISLSMNTSMPGFCKPMALSIPPYTSATRGVGLPGQGTLATPLVTTAPRRFRSTNSSYSMPEPKVPDAVITGFLKVTPAIVVCVFIRSLPPQHQIRGHRCRFSHYAHENDDPLLWSLPRSPGRHPRHRPYALPERYRP